MPDVYGHITYRYLKLGWLSHQSQEFQPPDGSFLRRVRAVTSSLQPGSTVPLCPMICHWHYPRATDQHLSHSERRKKKKNNKCQYRTVTQKQTPPALVKVPAPREKVWLTSQGGWREASLFVPACSHLSLLRMASK